VAHAFIVAEVGRSRGAEIAAGSAGSRENEGGEFVRVFDGVVGCGRRRGGVVLVAASSLAAALIAVSPAGAASVPPASPSAPSTSPSVAHKYYGNAGDIPKCRPGYVCATVAYGGEYHVFDFYRYGTYGLSNWHGRGALANEQAGGAAARIYDRSGAETGCVRAGTATAGVDWDSVSKIKLTTVRC
jgi:hypothetical protein